jgi:UDP-N-acetylmuramate: L-alanyl-gamma-D-glutamyl-meso-diaminopimelate ligase
MNIHFIAIGGSVMHNLAIALQGQGHSVSGSDDHIFDPSRSRLAAAGLLPEAMGWFPSRLHAQLDAVILGMHAKADNPELLEAQRLGLPVYSYPEFVYRHAQNKQRVVIAGSHGKTTVTSMVVHVLHAAGRRFDYVLGAVPKGLDATVRLSDDAPVIVIEGDEYPTSPLDPTPKFLHYRHHIGVVTGIAWDHYNAYPTNESYTEQFVKFVEATPKAGTLAYCSADRALDKLVKQAKLRHDVAKMPYEAHKNRVKDGVTAVPGEIKDWVPLRIFGDHNMMNLSAALAVCQKLGIMKEDFYRAIATFEGAPLRLQRLAQSADGSVVFRDFAHAPSKALATVEAVSKQYPKHRLLACFELHTYSSLNKAFIGAYRNALHKADVAAVFYNPETASRKGLAAMAAADIRAAFNRKDLQVISGAQELEQFLAAEARRLGAPKTVLLMSSGDFGGMDVAGVAAGLLG